MWKQLSEEVIPEVIANTEDGNTLRAWVCGCSTGEEAFSLAIVFQEALEKGPTKRDVALQIFATDLDSDAISRARLGVYPPNIAADVTEERLHRYFVQTDIGFQIGKEIREMVIFAPHNVISDPPFTKLDLLSCRNLLIYLDSKLQKSVMSVFHYSLKSRGCLMLGSAETAGGDERYFAERPGRNHLYRRLDALKLPDLTKFPRVIMKKQAAKVTSEDDAPPRAISKTKLENPESATIQDVAETILLRSYTPAAILVGPDGDILYVSGKTGRYLEPAAGKANWNLFVMARDGLRENLHETFHRALRTSSPVTSKSIRVEENEQSHFVDLTIHPLTDLATRPGAALVVFTESAKQQSSDEPSILAIPSDAAPITDLSILEELRRDLEHAHHSLRSSSEEMQAAKEDFRSVNEELQSTNEELQSTNEELVTSKEEMQSMNEELHVVNNELQIKVDELCHASDDMRNLLNSTEIATLFLDDALNIRRFTPQMTNIIKLIPGDIGRPITDLVTDLDYAEFTLDASNVLKTLATQEREITAKDSRWFSVRIMPYRTQDNRIGGVVITFTNITVSKALEAELRRTQELLEQKITAQRDELREISK